MKIAVIGMGGVGGYFGGKLAQLKKLEDDLEIFFIARNEHLQAIKENGLVLDSDEGKYICKPDLATDDFSELPKIDLYLLCVKSFDLHEVLSKIKTKISNQTMILPLLNGIDIYERIRSVISNGIVFPSCVYVGTHIEKPGFVKQRGGSCTIHFGEDPRNDFINPRLFDLFKKSNIKYKFSDNPYLEIWGKFMFIASFGLIAASYNKSIGEILESEVLSHQVKNIMNEIYLIATQMKIGLSESVVEESFNKGKNFSYDTKTSFQRDYENKNKPDERDLFGVTILRLGQKYGIKMETTEMIFNSIQKH